MINFMEHINIFICLYSDARIRRRKKKCLAEKTHFFCCVRRLLLLLSLIQEKIRASKEKNINIFILFISTSFLNITFIFFFFSSLFFFLLFIYFRCSSSNIILMGFPVAICRCQSLFLLQSRFDKRSNNIITGHCECD